MQRGCLLLRRFFGQYKWESYKDIELHKSQYETSFMRSSGPGGQSVNNTNSKAQLRLKLNQCRLVDQNILENLRSKHGSQINKNDELIIRSQTFKSQAQNLKQCFTKAQKLLFYSSKKKEEKKQEPYEQSQQNRERRLASKKKRSEIKSNRQGKNLFY